MANVPGEMERPPLETLALDVARDVDPPLQPATASMAGSAMAAMARSSTRSGVRPLRLCPDVLCVSVSEDSSKFFAPSWPIAGSGSAQVTNARTQRNALLPLHNLCRRNLGLDHRPAIKVALPGHAGTLPAGPRFGPCASNHSSLLSLFDDIGALDSARRKPFPKWVQRKMAVSKRA